MGTIVTPVTVITLDSTKITHNIKADLVARYFPPVVRLVQYDQSLPVIAVSLMQNGQTYTLPSGAAANIRVHKPDATYVYNPALGCDSTRNIVYFEVTQAMAAANGDGLAIVEIVVDGDIAGTSLITLHFEENPVPENAIESSDEWETIYELGERIIASTVTPVSTAAGMTDHNVVYLYTGTESGWNQGHMYYYNGTTWVDAGIAVTDTTLSVAGLAADAKKTGDEIADLKDGLNTVKEELQDGYITSNTFVQGLRGTDINVAVIARRCTTSTVFELHEGDKIAVKNIDSGLRVAVAGVADSAYTYDSGWQTSNYSYTIPHGQEGAYFANVSKTDNSNISPSDISTLTVIVTPNNVLNQTSEQAKETSTLFDTSLIYPRKNTGSELDTLVPFYAKAGDTITLCTSDSSAFTPQRIYLVDTNKNVVDWWNITGNASPRNITIPANLNDTYYFRFYGGTAQTITVYNRTRAYNPQTSLDIIDGQLFGLENSADTNLIENYFIVDNKFLDITTGNAYTSENYKCTDFIACKAGDTMKYSLYGTGSDDALVVKYDTSKTFISVLVTGTGAIQNGSVNIAEDCYLRVSNRFAAYTQPCLRFNSPVGIIKDTLESNSVWLIPNYTQEEIDTVDGKVSNLQGSNTISFAFLTDLHNGTSVDIRNANHHAIQSIYTIEKKVPLDCVVFGGDYLSNGASTTVDQCYAQIDDLMKYITKIKTDTFMLRGNHDSNPFNQSAPFTDAMFYKSTDKFFETKDIHMYTDDLGKCIGYVDLENLKVRLIFTNTTDVGTQAEGFGLSSAQIAWFGNVALNFSDKTDKENWGVIVFAHTYFVSSSIIDVTVSQEMHSILVAFKNGTAYGSYDFTQQGAMEVICAVVGHQHADKSALVDGIRVIATMQTAGGGDEAADDGNTYAKVWGTADETAYDIFTIDRIAKKIYTTRFGVGQDREWSY